MLVNKKKIDLFKSRLLNISDKEPLSKMSLVVIVALDIFVLIMIFSGLSDHTAQLTSPQEYMPQECREAFIENKWIGEGKLDNLQRVILSYENSYSYYQKELLDDSNIGITHPNCNKFLSSIKKIQKNKQITEIFEKRKNTQEEIKQKTSKFEQTKGVYDTTLLENISNDGKTSVNNSISKKSDILSNSTDQLTKNLTKQNKLLTDNSSIIEFSSTLEELLKTRKQTTSDIKEFDFWYPIRELAWQFLFLLPLFLLFYLWNQKSIKNNHNLQILISSHLLVVSFFPIFFRVIELVNNLLPHRLLKKIIDFLTSFNIIGLWHYIIIVISVIASILAIYFIQNKIFSKQNIAQKRLMKGACCECGKKIPHNSKACPFCGAQQHKPCPKCQTNTYKAGSYCTHCGSRIQTE